MEMNQETLDKMRQMRLLGMYNAFKISMESFKTESMTTDQFVAWLVSPCKGTVTCDWKVIIIACRTAISGKRSTSCIIARKWRSI